MSADKLQKLPLQVNPEESASNGDMENPLSNANIDKTKDLGSTSSVGTFSLQSGRGHERADSSESIYRCQWHQVLWRGWCRSFHDIYISVVLFNVVFVSQWCSVVICNNVKCLFVYKKLGL